MGSLKAFFKCFIPAIPFPSWFFFMDRCMGNGVKLGPQGSRQYARAHLVFCVLLAGLQIDLCMGFVTDMALAAQTDKPSLAADGQGLTELVPGLSGWTVQLHSSWITCVPLYKLWRHQRLPLYLSCGASRECISLER